MHLRAMSAFCKQSHFDLIFQFTLSLFAWDSLRDLREEKTNFIVTQLYQFIITLSRARYMAALYTTGNHEISPCTIMPDNRVSSKPSDVPSPPTFSENLIFQRAFQFQPRRGNEPLDLRRISGVDIPKLVEAVDIELLQSFLENITFAEVSEEDFDLYSNECFVKLFTIAQLTLEYLLDVQDTLSVNLNSLAKKYAAKKREMDMLSKNLARQDAVVAALRDEIHYSKEVVRRYETRRSTDPGSSPALATFVKQDQDRASVEENVIRTDPSLYPSQERRKVSNQIDDFSPHVPKFSESDGAIRLHVVISSVGKYIELNVVDSITIQSLKEKIVDAMLDGLDECKFPESFTLSYLGNNLEDLSQTVKECGIENNVAIVAGDEFVPIREHAESPETLQPIKDDILEKLEEFTSIAIKTQKSLVDVTRMLQDQALSQQAKKDGFVAEVEKQLQTFERIIHEEVQRGVGDAFKRDTAVNKDSDYISLHLKSSDEGDYESKSSTNAPGSGSDDDEGDVDDNFEVCKKIDHPVPSEKLNITVFTNGNDSDSNPANASDKNGEDHSLGSLVSILHNGESVPHADRGKIGKLDLGLRVETDNALFNPDSNQSPLLPPKEIKVTPHDHNDAQIASGTGKDDSGDCFGDNEKQLD
ncbi:hypothetical protein ACHAXS_013310 [Conticribra weissflogii]